MSPELDYKLSPEGEARRELMLAGLTSSMRSTHRARKLLRRGVGAAVMALAIVAATRFEFVVPIGPDAAITQTSEPAQPQPGRSYPAVRGQVCVNRHGDRRPARARPTSRAKLLDDGALITALVQLDRPAGLIRTENGVRLSAPVTDAELGIKPEVQ